MYPLLVIFIEGDGIESEDISIPHEELFSCVIQGESFEALCEIYGVEHADIDLSAELYHYPSDLARREATKMLGDVLLHTHHETTVICRALTAEEQDQYVATCERAVARAVARAAACADGDE